MAAGPARAPTRVALVPASNGTPKIAAKLLFGSVEKGTLIKVLGPANRLFERSEFICFGATLISFFQLDTRAILF